MGNISNRLYKVIFFGPLIILILERILGSVSFVHTPDFGVLSSDLSSFAAPHEISRPSLRKEVYRLQQIERHDERLTSQEALDYESEQRLKKEMAGEFVAEESNQSDLIPLNDLVDMAEQITCDEDHRKVEDKHLPYERLFDDLKIPRIVHQTSRTRCLTKKLWNIVQSWSLGPDWAHYLHSDHAVDRLFQKHWPEFPHLSLLLQCLENKGTLKADLWRYLVLWEYGGVYADVDTKPNLFNHSTITSQDDGFFIVEQYHLLSQYFMATSPRHPIMFYTIHQVLSRLLDERDTGSIIAPQVTGPHALNRGFQLFMNDGGVSVQDPGVGKKPAKAGVWVGTDHRSITVAGVGENENEYVFREYIKRYIKIKEYNKMGMEHFTREKNKTDKSCMRALWEAQAHSREQLRRL